MNNNLLMPKPRAVLKPIIEKAIRNIRSRGIKIITAKQVSEECKNLDKNIEWGNRTPAICNTMRKVGNKVAVLANDEKDNIGLTIKFS